MSEEFDSETPDQPESPHPSEPLGESSSSQGAWAGSPGPSSGPGAWAGPLPPNPPAGWGPTASPAASRRRRGVRATAAGALVAGTLAASIGIGHLIWPSKSSGTPTAATSPGSSGTGTNPFYGSGGSGQFFGSPGTGSGGSSGSSNSSGSPSDVSSIASKIDPALVDINVTFGYQQTAGAGTGIVLTPNGEILTNNHVIEGATSISVTDVGNGQTYKATVVGYDPSADVAVLQLQNASGLQTASIASSSASVGEAVVAVGNAGGTGGTPTASGGSVTAVNQAITASDELSGTNENLTGLIETNADVQSGDSGGSLVNGSGQVVGMDTAAAQGYSLSSQTNQGYAIPIKTALAIASQIESGNASSTVHVGSTAFLGVLISSSGSSNGDGNGFFGGQSAGGSTTNGALISGTTSGSPAAQAGLAQGDVITSIDGHAVSSPSDLTALINGHKPGDQVQIGWTDSTGASHTSTVTLASGPAQ